MSVIDDLKRLERAGGEYSKTSQKLREAVISVAEKILELTESLPEGTELPRDYLIDTRCGGSGGNRVCYRYLIKVEKIPDLGYEEYKIVNGALDKDFYIMGDIVDGTLVRVVPRELCLQFAKDVATGWIDEVAAVVEKFTEETISAVEDMGAEDAG